MPNQQNPDPLANIKIILGVIMALLKRFFTKTVPLIALTGALILGILYLFFKLFGLV